MEQICYGSFPCFGLSYAFVLKPSARFSLKRARSLDCCCNLNTSPLFSIVNQIKSYVNELPSVKRNVSWEYSVSVSHCKHCWEHDHSTLYTCLANIYFFLLFFFAWCRWCCCGCCCYHRIAIEHLVAVMSLPVYAFAHKNGWSVIAVVIIKDRSKVYKYNVANTRRVREEDKKKPAI